MSDRQASALGGGVAWAEAAAVLVLALALRLAFVAAFPTVPLSDFRAILDFGIYLRDTSLVTGGWFWDLLNPGLPLVVAGLTALVPGDPETTLRIATAVATALLAPLPVLLWPRAPRRARLTAAGLLAAWPGQVAFSGVLAQDNWVLLPVVALCCLAVACLHEGGVPRPVAGALLYALAVAFRQEMLLVMLPPAVACAIGPREGRARRLLVAALAAAAPLLLLALQRQAATGRFALSSEHGGTALLGSFVPGATASGWADPIPHVAAVAPHLLEDLPRLRREAARLAVEEAIDRPAFHAQRVAALTLVTLLGGEASNLAWSLHDPGVLEDPAARRRAGAVRRPLALLLRWELAVLAAAFVTAAAALFAARRRWHLPLLLAMVLKVAVHAVTVVQGRFFLAVTALAILVIGLGVEVAPEIPRRALAAAAAVAVALVAAASALSPRLFWRVLVRDVVPQRAYAFALAAPEGTTTLGCRAPGGRLGTIDPRLRRAVVALPVAAPGAAGSAALRCRPRAVRPPGDLLLRLRSSPAPGAPAAPELRVTVAGREVWRGGLGAGSDEWHEVDFDERSPAEEILVERVALPDGAGGAQQEASVALELAFREPRL